MDTSYLTPEYREFLRQRNLSRSYKKHKYGYQLTAKLRGYKERALQKNQEWKLTDDEALECFVSDCYYCGQRSVWDLRTLPAGAKLKPSGIDRLKNDVGYTKENVVPCCYRCNVAKNNLEIEDFLGMVKRIYENLELRKERTNE